MEEYCVVRFDDGIMSCVKASALITKNDQHSARWKNTWYHVFIIMSGDKKDCENIILNTGQKAKYADEKTLIISTGK